MRIMVSWCSTAWRRASAGLAIAAIAGASSLTACGSKTGLDLPDVIVPPIEQPPCVEVPTDPMATVTIDLSTDAELRRADVFFLIDTTRSMEREISEIRSRLRDRLAPAIYAQIPDTNFGVGTVADFPLAPFGDAQDVPYQLMRQLTGDLAATQGAVDLIRLGNGGDAHEAQLEALYQVATGAGLGSFIEPSLGCPNGGTGGACFRRDAFPVVLLFTDAPMHGGPATGEPYSGITPRPHTYQETIDALRARNIRVLGLWSNVPDSTRQDLVETVRDSGGVDSNGQPIVVNIGTDGERLDTGIANVLREYARSVIFNIGAVPIDPTPADGFDVTALVEAITPLSASPMSGIDRINVEDGTFEGVVSGTRVTFQIVVRGGSYTQGPTAQRYRLQVDFRTGGSTYIGSGEVDLVIPGLDGSGCDDLPPLVEQ